MATMTNIAIRDDAATLFTLIPVTDTPVPVWETRTANVPIDSQMRLTESVVKQKNGSFKITAKLEVPVMETLGSSGTSAGYVAPPKRAYVTACIFTMFADKRSTIADRSNALKMTIGLLQGATSSADTGSLVQASVANSWSGSVAPTTYLFSSLVIPS